MPTVAPSYPETAQEIIRDAHWHYEQIYNCVALCNSLEDELDCSMGLTSAETNNLRSQVASIKEYLLKHAEIVDQDAIRKIKRAKKD